MAVTEHYLKSSKIDSLGPKYDTAPCTLSAILPRMEKRAAGSKGIICVIDSTTLSSSSYLEPYALSPLKKVSATIIVTLITILVGVVSSIDSVIGSKISHDFEVSEVVSNLVTAAFLFTFGAGSLIAAPLSERFGRSKVYICSMSLLAASLTVCGCAPNFQILVIFRAVAGLSASAPLVCGSASLSDIWSIKQRTLIFPIYSILIFMGPVMGPVIGSGIVKISWRWCYWSMAIITAFTLPIVLVLLPETYTPYVLTWIASYFRNLTGDERYLAPSEVSCPQLRDTIRYAFTEPFKIVFSDVLVALTALYLCVLYLILFSFFSGFHEVFGVTYQLDQIHENLAFVGVAVGMLLLTPIAAIFATRTILKRPGLSKPEDRMQLAFVSSWTIPTGLIWMGVTATKGCSIWSSFGATTLVGYGIAAIYVSFYEYILDSYKLRSASALASVVALRYCVCAGIVVCAGAIYRRLQPRTTLLILAGLGLFMIPVPFYVYLRGERLRQGIESQDEPINRANDCEQTP